MKFTSTLFIFLFGLSVNLYAQNETLPGRETPMYTNFEAVNFPIPSSGAMESLKGYFNIDKRYSFSPISTLQDGLGFTHTRYKQYSNGIPVEGSMWILHEKNNQLVSVNGDVFTIKTNNTTPSITASQALTAAINFIGASTYMWQLSASQLGDEATLYGKHPVGELVFVPEEGAFGTKEFKLAYKFDISAAEPHERAFVFIDAMNAKPLWKLSMIHEINNVVGTGGTLYSGTQNLIIDSTSASSYRLYDSTRGKGIRTKNLNNATTGTGSDVTSTTKSFTSATNEVKAIFDAHWGLGLTFDYFKDTFNRSSYDGQGGALLVKTRYGNNYNNAFWNNRTISFGDGNSFSPLTALDVAGHEFSHGVTEYTAGLYYNGESGALNESFSDIFGNCIEFINKPSVASWALGEDLISGGLRNMSNPNLKNDPDTYLGTHWITSKTDNFGVHTNSGVQNFWFYLLSVGGSGTNDNSNAYSVTGLGMNKAAQIAYRNLSVYLTPTSNYAMARQFAIQSARDLYGNCSNEVTQTTAAWYAVGVGANVGTTGSSFNNTPSSTCKNYLSVNFYNTSPAVQSSYWDFGDGSNSTSNHPTHTYTQPGTYNVKLKTTHCNSQVDSITVNAAVSVSGTSTICDTIKMNKPVQNSLLCNAIVTDDGGTLGNYANDSATYLLFEDPTATQYKVSFLNFKTENGYDYLYLIDGDSLSAPYFYYTGSFATPPAQFVTTQNKLLILFEPDNAVNDSGFILKVECISPLPIELLSWNVEAKNCTNYLEWTIGSTKDFSHFDIEMSDDGKLFTKLGSIKFNPNEMNYSFADYLTNETQKLRYYRLKMVDINDAFTYSKVISILPKCNGKVAWTLSPNPAHSQINIKYGEELYRVNILNANGALVRVVNIENASYAAINIEDLASGTYLIEAVNSKGVKQYKIFVKQ